MLPVPIFNLLFSQTLNPLFVYKVSLIKDVEVISVVFFFELLESDCAYA